MSRDRDRPVPHGGVRIAVAHLAVVGTLVAAALWGVIAWQVAAVLPPCQADDTGLCPSLWGGAATLVGLLALLWLAASWAGLSGWFWLVCVLGFILASQAVVQTGSFAWLFPLLGLPTLAAVLSEAARGRTARLGLVAATAVVALESAVWLALLLQD